MSPWKQSNFSDSEKKITRTGEDYSINLSVKIKIYSIRQQQITTFSIMSLCQTLAGPPWFNPQVSFALA